MEHLNLPITGICSFGKYPICTDLSQLDADIAVLGVPVDFAVGYMSGARLAPAEFVKPPPSMDVATQASTILKAIVYALPHPLKLWTVEMQTFYMPTHNTPLTQ